MQYHEQTAYAEALLHGVPILPSNVLHGRREQCLVRQMHHPWPVWTENPQSQTGHESGL